MGRRGCPSPRAGSGGRREVGAQWECGGPSVRAAETRAKPAACFARFSGTGTATHPGRGPSTACGPRLKPISHT